MIRGIINTSLIPPPPPRHGSIMPSPLRPSFPFVSPPSLPPSLPPPPSPSPALGAGGRPPQHLPRVHGRREPAAQAGPQGPHERGADGRGDAEGAVRAAVPALERLHAPRHQGACVRGPSLLVVFFLPSFGEGNRGGRRGGGERLLLCQVGDGDRGGR